ncbi:Bax inhibitor-1/YccA family protein [Novosphingobium sp.]|uniref:Bax inhibitor-1/YccA family protein n=1 Tax=Novosphingobium sp. TaxID=1874826 RepID=UPI0035B3CF66
MADWNDRQPTGTGFGASPSLNGISFGGVSSDEGLRRHMLAIYNYMASGVLLSGIIAMLFARSGMALQLMTSPLGFVIQLAPLGFILAMSFGLNRMQTSTLQILFWAFAATMGLSLSMIFLVYTGGSIAVAFFSTAAAFAGLSLYGYSTGRDLSGLGTFFLMGLIGLIVASLLNLWLKSPGLYWATSVIGVLIFAGLTAYDTQKLKEQYAYVAGTDFAGKAVVMGALNLYLDFINMFLYLLRFLGDRR